MNRLYILAVALMMVSCSKNTTETEGVKRDNSNEIHFQTKINSLASDSGFNTLKDGTAFHLYFLESGQLSYSRFILGNSLLDISTLPFNADTKVTMFSIYPTNDAVKRIENRIVIPQNLNDKDVLVMFNSQLSLKDMKGSLQTFSHAMHLLRVKVTDDVSTRTPPAFFISLKTRRDAYLDLNDGKIKVDASSSVEKMAEKEGSDVSWFIFPQNIEAMEISIRKENKEISLPLRSLMKNQENVFLGGGVSTYLSYDWSTGECKISTDVHPWGNQGEVASDINY